MGNMECKIIVEQGEDGHLISEVVGLPGCHTRGRTFDELMKRTRKAIQLCKEGFEGRRGLK